MSCRVIGRTVEHFFFAELLQCASDLGYREIAGEYIPTKKNALVSELYDGLGFQRVRDGDGGTVLYALAVDTAAPPTTYLSRKGAACLVVEPD